MPWSIEIFDASAPAAPVPPPPPRGGRSPGLGSRAPVPSVEMFMRPSRAWTTTSTGAATTPTSHFNARLTRLRRRSGALDGRQPPRIRPDGTGERPELLELLRRLRAVDQRARRIVHGVIDERAGEVHGDEVLTGFLPGLGHLAPPHVDPLHAVALAGGPQAIALARELRVHSRRDSRAHRAHVARRERALHVTEETTRGVADDAGIERRIHRANMSEPAIEIAGDRRRLGYRDVLHAASRIAAAGVRSAGRRICRLRVTPCAHEPEQQEQAAADQDDFEQPDPTAEAVTEAAEQHAAEQPAEREAGKAAHHPAEPATARRLRRGRGRRR